MSGGRLEKERLKTYLKEINLVSGEGGEAIRMLRLMPERTMNIDEGVFAYSVDCQKVFGRVNRDKLTQILKHRDVGWRERNLIRKRISV
jgi:hypothetical protein